MPEEKEHEVHIAPEENHQRSRSKLAAFFYRPRSLLFVAAGILLLFVFGAPLLPHTDQIAQIVLPSPTPTIMPSPTPIPFTTYKRPQLTKGTEFFVYLIGDSMTNALGPRGGIFNEEVSNAHKGIFLQIFNYSQANQSIETLPQRLFEPVQADKDLLLPPVMDGKPDLIILESFGYNPLSNYGLEGGLKKQNELLTQIMTTLTNKFPNTVIMFLATIAPDRDFYGKNLGLTDRASAADERIAYIKNHIKYAEEHNIPLINVYQESLDAEGDGAEIYISPDDTVHPSNAGSELISKTMTRRIVEEKVFPQLSEPQ